MSANLDCLHAWFVFYARLNFEVRKNIPPLPSFVYNSRKKGKNQKRPHGFRATFYGSILAKFELKRKLDARDLNTCTQFLENMISRKRAKQFQTRSSGLMREGVKVITCGLQANGSTYFITIALK